MSNRATWKRDVVSPGNAGSYESLGLVWTVALVSVGLCVSSRHCHPRVSSRYRDLPGSSIGSSPIPDSAR